MTVYNIDITVQEYNVHGDDDAKRLEQYSYNIVYNGSKDDLDMKKFVEVVVVDLLLNDVEFIRDFDDDKAYVTPKTADELTIDVYGNGAQVCINGTPYTDYDLNGKPYRTHDHLVINIEVKDLKPKIIEPFTDDNICEWIEYDYRTMCPSNHGDVDNPYWRIPYDAVHLSFCPYCGKKIRFTDRDGVVRW